MELHILDHIPVTFDAEQISGSDDRYGSRRESLN